MRTQGLLLISLLATVACADGQTTAQTPANPSTPAPPSDLRGSLAEPRTLLLTPASALKVTAERTYGGGDVSTVTLDVKQGKVVVEALEDGTVSIDEIDAELGDIIVSPDALPPNGMHFSGIKVTLRQPAYFTGAWTADGNAMASKGDLSLALDWSIVGGNGSVIQLATVKIDHVPISFKMSRDAQGRPVIQASLDKSGVIFTWSSLLELSNLDAQLVGAQTAGL